MINIYRASAGSGKTHKLAGEYIKLLFSQPNAYKHILAVTFTNKATDEMKQRILKELYNLSCGNTKSDYLKDIQNFTNKDESWIRDNARNILIEILHNYSAFFVSTIDKFFQLIMRSFAKELGKMATYNVELDHKIVLANAVDRMFSDLDNPDNKKLLKWLIDYSLEAVDKGDSWNVKGEILKLAEQIFREDFKILNKDCEDKTTIDDIWNLKNKLKKQIDAFEIKLKKLGEEGLNIIANEGLSLTSFKGVTKTPFKYLTILSNCNNSKVDPPVDSFIKLFNNLDNWYSGKQCPAEICNVYNNLNKIIGEILEEFDINYEKYLTAYTIINNINVLGILNDIYLRVLSYCKEKNIILLSESTELLNRIIDGSDTPFVYEKIGARLDNYMLDEFQDTSILQWKNFYPLLQNSLANGNDNLIVGDVKQSIYRWRGSDWNILNNQIYREFRNEEVANYSLDNNWRSGANIVGFNNEFFAYCAKLTQSLYGDKDNNVIEQIYSNFQQLIPDKMLQNPGYVEVNFINNEEEGFEQNVLNNLPQKIKEILDAGYKQKDIAILLRKKKQGNNLAVKLLENGYDIITDDSLTIESSLAVQKIINILRELDNPNSTSLAIYKKFMDVPKIENIKMFSLYQLCESIIRESLTNKEKEDVAFLQAFLDIVLDYTNKEGTNISQFLKWCDEGGLSKSISAPQDLDAIKIMTIHKSKGLGFKVVIIPFLEEAFEPPPFLAPTLWCKFEKMAVPIKYVKDLVNTDFRDAYFNEKLCSYIDSLNTAYVAFTRPKQELIVFAKETELNSKGEYKEAKSIADILLKYYLETDSNICNDGIKQIVIGEHSINKNENNNEEEVKKVDLKNVFSFPLNLDRTKAATYSGSISNGESIREHGIIMHYIFSLIETKEDINKAVEKCLKEGIWEFSKKELLDLITKKINSVKQYNWFSGEYETLNECNIITQEGDQLRPDRVIIKGNQAIVIDYKFGGYQEDNTHQNKLYIKQVKNYKKLLLEMGYTNVSGYLWYITEDVIIQV